MAKGERPTPFVRQILDHELTHALQDQHFNLDRELNDLYESYLAFEALIEGDASRIENLYLESLAPGERGLLTLLLQTLPEEQAWEAADGWAGDYNVAWKKGGQSCVKMSVVTDSRKDKDELVLALRAWALKQKLVSITTGKTIGVRSCA